MTIKIYRVGGCVRDKLLGIIATDNDYVVVGASIKEMITKGFIPIGKDFPVFLHPKTHEEYALARIDKKTSIGYKGFEFYANRKISLFEDLKRRDITINAIAEDMDGNLYDPFNGVADLRNKIIRHVSDSFSEDPLRVIRVARFGAKYNFEIAQDTMNLMINISKSPHELESLSVERLYIELEKIIDYDFIKFFMILKRCNAIQKIFTEFNLLTDDILLQDIIKQNFYNKMKPLDAKYKILLLLSIINVYTHQKQIPVYIKNKNHIEILNKVFDVYEIILQILITKDLEILTNLYFEIITKISNRTKQSSNNTILLFIDILINGFIAKNGALIIKNLDCIQKELSKINYLKLTSGKNCNQIKDIIYNYKQNYIKNILRSKYFE